MVRIFLLRGWIKGEFCFFLEGFYGDYYGMTVVFIVHVFYFYRYNPYVHYLVRFDNIKITQNPKKMHSHPNLHPKPHPKKPYT